MNSVTFWWCSLLETKKKSKKNVSHHPHRPASIDRHGVTNEQQQQQQHE